MKRYLVPLLLSVGLAVAAGPDTIRVVNAASFLADRGLAPGSIISVLGTGLTNTTAGVADPAAPPFSLGGVTLTIGGKLSPLFYVSPTQVNAQIDSTLTPNPATPVVLTSPTGTFSTTINVQAAVPAGVFSLFGTGTRDGAILNAVTFALGPFTVTTAGAPTYLAIFATGLNLAAAPVVTIGGVQVPVDYFGKAPCCLGLQQINVELVPALAGAGRVEVAMTTSAGTSNIVEVVILPSVGQGPQPPSADDTARSRELASIAYIGGSLALLADENDDVLRIIDAKAMKTIHTITLADGAQPSAIGVTADGKTAVVAERGRGKAAIVDLVNYLVTAEVTVGGGPGSVAIFGSQAVVVNQDSDSVSIVSLTVPPTVSAPIAVGRGPRAVAVNASTAYVTNEDSGTISVISPLIGTPVVTTISLGADVRPQAIQIVPALGLPVVTVPSNGPNGTLMVVNLATGAVTSFAANPDKSGGSSDLAAVGQTIYAANQSGASVTVATVAVSGTGVISLNPVNVKVDIGARALAVNTADKLLLVTNEGSGTVSVIDLTSNKVIGAINGVQSESGNGKDDNSDRNQASNLPVVTSVAPNAASAPSHISILIKGTNLTGATNVYFVDPATLPGNGKGNNGNQTHGPFGSFDSAFSVTNIKVDAAGVTLTADVVLSADKPGTRVVRVETPNGTSTFDTSSGNTFTIQ